MNIGMGLSLLGKVIGALKSHSSHENKGADFFSKLDKDGSGGISKAELADFKSLLASETAPKGPAGMLAQMFDQIDTDKSGEVTPEELKAGREMMRERMQQLSSTDLWTRIFNNIDKNGDGQISPEELQAALQGMQGQMQSASCCVPANGPSSIQEYLSSNPQTQTGGTAAIV